MKYTPKPIRRNPPFGFQKSRIMFAFFPKETIDGGIVWLEKYKQVKTWTKSGSYDGPDFGFSDGWVTTNYAL